MVEALEILSPEGGIHEDFEMGGHLRVQMRLRSPDERPPVAMFGVVRLDGSPVYGVSSEDGGVEPRAVPDSSGIYEIALVFNNLSLLPGQYILRGHALDPEGMRVCDTMERTFRVRGETREMGLIRLPHQWH